MKRIIICLILLSLSIIAMAQTTRVITAQNQAPMTYTFGENVTMRVEVNIGANDVKTVRLRYSYAQETIYHTQEMRRQAPGSLFWETVLKSSQIKDKDVRYYYEFVLNDQSVEILPLEFEVNGPYTLTPGPMSGKLEEGFILLSTEGEFESDAFVFAVSFFEIADEISPSSIRVWVGGSEVTKASTITNNTVVYRDSKTNGEEVRALITAVKGGKKVQSQLWNIKTPKIKARSPFIYSGSVNFASNIHNHDYSATLTDVIESENDWMAWGDASINYGIATAYTNLLFSSLEDKNAQRVNRYTIGFMLPFWEIVAGDYTPQISHFVLNNRNQYGLYSKLYERQMGLEVMAGEIVRSTKLPSTDDNGLPIQAPGGTFRQEVVGGRLRIGTEQGFSIGINGVRNRDIISSLSKEIYSYTDQNGNVIYTVTPEDNIVASLDMRIHLPEQSVVLGAEVAGSFLNTNTIDPTISAEDIGQLAPDLDFIDPGELAELFVINRNMQPFMPSKHNLAATAYLRTIVFKNLLNISYTAVGSAFNSHSINQYPKDTSQINVSNQYYLGRYFNLNGGFSRTKNNLSLTGAETQTSDSWFVQAMLRIQNLPYLKGSYFNTTTTNENNGRLQDPSLFVPYKRNSNSLSVGLGYDIKQIPVLPSQLDLTYRMGTSNSFQGANNNLMYENFSNSINVSMTNRLVIIPLKTQFVFSRAAQDRDLGTLSLPDLSNSNYNLFARAEYALLAEKIIPYTSYRRVNLTGDLTEQSFDYISLGLDARPIQNMSISTGINQRIQKFKADSNLKNNLLTWSFTISQKF
ncbi:MAG TPA: hypothetical protein PL126_04665 [Candidatus Cloacimonadota bacterium]|nr:hypothetical protein [Candidatus Cloacimonadota bacterium]